MLIHFRKDITRTEIVRLALGLAFCLPVALDSSRAVAQAVHSPPIFPGRTSPLLLAPSAVPPEAAYTLGAGDLIRIDLFDVPEYSGDKGRYQVLVDGSLNLPLVGNVVVQGMTLKQAANELSARYARYFKRSLVTVSLLAPRPLRIGISGEVSSPGVYTVEPLKRDQQTGDSGTKFPTLTLALKTAGGVSQSANIRQIQVHRPQASGQIQTIQVDLWKMLKQGDLSQDLTLRDGDAIVVPVVSQVDLAESLQLADTSFAADKGKPLNVAIVGEVFRPGTYTLTGSARLSSTGIPAVASPGTADSGNEKGIIQSNGIPTVTRAIQIAGGIKPLANIRQIQIRRLTRTGAEQVIQVDLFRLLQAGDLTQDAVLQSGDTISIPLATQINTADAAQIASASFSPDRIRVNVVGEVRQPGVVQVPPGTPLNQALLAAGGFDTRRAHQKDVDLIRLNSDGTVVRRKIAINLAQGMNDVSNPEIRNNDVIIVRRSGLVKFTDTLGNVLSPVNSLFSISSFIQLFSPSD